MAVNSQIIQLLTAFAVGYLPGVIIGLVLWYAGRRSNHPMPLFHADLISFAAPIIIWLVMFRYNLTLTDLPHNNYEELAILGWIWSLCVLGRSTIPRFTHKLRFRLAAIHTGSICIIAAVLLALFYQIIWD